MLLFKDKLRNFALSTFEKFKKHKPKLILSQDEKDALKGLSRDKSILISRPDKDNGVVLIDETTLLG